MDSAYDGLLEATADESAHWAFGHGFEDPLAGMDLAVPDGVDAEALAAHCLALGDDALVASHRLAEWCSNAPELEDDVAIANIALDLLGQARLLLSRAAAADPGVVPVLPEGSPAPAEDALAYFREAPAFRNVRLVEVPNGDFADLVVRLLLLSSARLAVFEHLTASPDPVLAAIASKGVKELAYHRDYAARWFVTLAQGTAESRRRLLTALDALWPLHDELVTADPVDVRDQVDAVLDQVFAAGEVARPEVAPMAAVNGRTGRDGMHTEALSRILAELQSVARAHPLGRW